MEEVVGVVGPAGAPGGGLESVSAFGSASTLLPWLLRPLLLVEGAFTMMVGMGMELFSGKDLPRA